MENEIIKQAFKLGNSAGVLLPVEWKDKKVIVKLIDKSISQEIFEILDQEGWLANTLGVFLAGSYARGEETESSDIDILVITDSINKQLKIGKYEILLVSKERLLTQIKKSLYFISMINEAKAILNNDLLKICKKEINGIPLKKSIEDIKSVTRINEKMVSLDEELGGEVLDETIYSLVLRMRELYLMECLNNNKAPSNKEFINLVGRIASKESYNAYLRIKNDLRARKIISPKEAGALIVEIKKRIATLEHGKKN